MLHEGVKVERLLGSLIHKIPDFISQSDSPATNQPGNTVSAEKWSQDDRKQVLSPTAFTFPAADAVLISQVGDLQQLFQKDKDSAIHAKQLRPGEWSGSFLLVIQYVWFWK